MLSVNIMLYHLLVGDHSVSERGTHSSLVIQLRRLAQVRLSTTQQDGDAVTVINQLTLHELRVILNILVFSFFFGERRTMHRGDNSMDNVCIINTAWQHNGCGLADGLLLTANGVILIKNLSCRRESARHSSQCAW